MRAFWPALLVLVACGDTPITPDPRCTVRVAPTGNVASDTAALKSAFINAQSGDVICLDDGTFQLDERLALATPNVTVLGTNIEHRRTAILDFSRQGTGDQAISLDADHSLIENLTIKNSPGHAVDATKVDYVTFRNLAITWDSPDEASHGPYGVFPVECNHVLIEDNDISGSRDAGIYTGQSTSVIVRRNRLHRNVGGIEVELSTDVEVYDNEATDNTAGVLIFAIPGRPVKTGSRCLVHDNDIHDNNHVNFGAGNTIVAMAPVGCGVIVMANDQTELTGNTITGNDSVGVAVIARTTINKEPLEPEDITGGYNQYVTGAFLHDNVFSGNGRCPDTLARVPAQVCNLSPRIPDATCQSTALGADIYWDGTFDPEVTGQVASDVLCVQEASGTTFLQFDDLNGSASCSSDLAPHDCVFPELPPLPSTWD